MVTFKLNDEFMFGTATASTQIEGGDTGNTWYKWCRKDISRTPAAVSLHVTIGTGWRRIRSC